MIGTAGKENKQDCLVRVEIKKEGGIEVSLKSSVGKLFGNQMKRAAAEAADELEVMHAYIEIIDDGSFDYAIKARTKTAIKRAGRGQN
ncbi:MAG: hypothetical protein APF77_00885 [Clostridia bacterium BRH_c25]|nr:MAG: hypothetical protein APF77_00885 [Clostridia bacterium BRH_c25]